VNITELKPYYTIVLMGFAVYINRASGYWLAGRIKINKAIAAWMNYLPGCIIISIVAPFVLHANGLEAVAAVVTAVAMWRTKNLLVAMVLGIGIVALGRQFL